MSLGVTRRAVLAGLVLASISALPHAARAQITFPDWYTLANAASQNKVDDVASLLRRGDNPNFLDSAGRSPLSYAAALGNTTMIRLLLDYYARIDYRDKFGSTPLHWAAENGRSEAVKQLLVAKAPVDAPNKEGITPLMLAAGNNRGDVVRLLLQGGADPKKQDFTGRDAMSWAAGQPSALRVLQTAAHSS